MDLKRFSIDDDLYPFFCENGFVVVTDLFESQALTEARHDLFRLFQERLKDCNPNGLEGIELLTYFYDNEKERWRQAARRMYDLVSVYRLAVQPRLSGLLRRLGLRSPLIDSRPEVRTDMPHDRQYIQPWHQDWRYGQGSLNSVSIWTALHDVTVANGTIDVMPGTHRFGYLACDELTNPRRFVILDPRIDEIPFTSAELTLGEAVIFSQFTVHRSGYNASDKPRLSVQLRFSDFEEPKFIANGMQTPSGGSDLLWPEPPDEAALGKMFTIG